LKKDLTNESPWGFACPQMQLGGEREFSNVPIPSVPQVYHVAEPEEVSSAISSAICPP